MLSVIIPSRNVETWPFLQKTIDDLFAKAMGEIEVIVILDGFQPNPPIKSRSNLRLVYHKEAQGMRQGINLGASLAKGKHIMKCDDHCLFGTGFDIILAADVYMHAMATENSGRKPKSGTKSIEWEKFTPVTYESFGGVIAPEWLRYDLVK